MNFKFWNKKTQNKNFKENLEQTNKENAFEIENLSLWYKNGQKQALFNINTNIKLNKVTALIGPSGCGKSTFLRELNRMNDEVEGVKKEGNIFFEGKNINSKKFPVTLLRTKVGMVFQKPTPFPISIYDNVAYGPKSNGIERQDGFIITVASELMAIMCLAENEDDFIERVKKIN